MFNLAKVKDYEDLTIENILKYISQRDIFEYYFGDKIDTNQQYKNPLRVDNRPGCRFFYSNIDNNLLFKDFSIKSPPIWCFEFVRLKYNLTNGFEVLNLINKDFKLGLGYVTHDFEYDNKVLNFEKREDLETIRLPIKCRIQDFNKFDLNYWNQFGISLSTLQYFNVYAVKHVIKGNDIIWKYSTYNPIYMYHFPNDNKKKIYRPFEKNKNFKFISSPYINEVYQGYDQLPKVNEYLILTKSMKDVMTLYELGYVSIAPNGEGYDISNKFVNHLYTRFDKLIIFYDNDKAGLNNAESLCEKIGCNYVYIPDEYKCKDISDYYKKYKKQETLTLLNQLIK
jgi:hypothetical protein